MKILFLCVANSARSQMAEAFARKYLGNQSEIASAGSVPGSRVNQLAIQVMAEKGLDLSGYYPKSPDRLASDFIENLDYAVTLCEDRCPILPAHAKHIHWPLPDPKTLEDFRKVRDEIEKRLQSFKDGLP